MITCYVAAQVTSFLLEVTTSDWYCFIILLDCHGLVMDGTVISSIRKQQKGTRVFPTIVGVRQEKQVLDDLYQCAQLSVFLRGFQPHHELLQPFLQFLSVNHCLWSDELTCIYTLSPSRQKQGASNRRRCGGDAGVGRGERSAAGLAHIITWQNSIFAMSHHVSSSAAKLLSVTAARKMSGSRSFGSGPALTSQSSANSGGETPFLFSLLFLDVEEFLLIVRRKACSSFCTVTSYDSGERNFPLVGGNWK